MELADGRSAQTAPAKFAVVIDSAADVAEQWAKDHLQQRSRHLALGSRVVSLLRLIATSERNHHGCATYYLG